MARLIADEEVISRLQDEPQGFLLAGFKIGGFSQVTNFRFDHSVRLLVIG